MTRRVVMLTNAVVEDKQGGLYRYVSELSAALARRGVEVTVLTKKVTPDAADVEVTPAGVRIERYGVPSKANPLFALAYPVAVVRAVHRALRRYPDAVVHAHFPVPGLVPLLLRRPYLYTFHAPVYRELLGERRDSYVLPRPVQRAAVAALRTAETRILRRARRVVLLSEFIRGELALLDPGAASRALLCPGGVDLDRFSIPDEAEAQDADAAGWPLVVVARRLVWRTGVIEAVEAMACGTPVVATPIGANDEVVGAFDARWMAPGRDAVAIGAGVVAVLKEVGDARWSPEVVRAHVAPRYGWDTVAAAHVALYDGVLS